MEGFLLDTNIISFLADFKEKLHVPVRDAHLQLADQVPVFVSSISHGEIEYGMRTNPKLSLNLQKDIHKMLEHFSVLDISASTREAYGEIRSRLFERFIVKGRKKKRPEQLVDPVTSLQLGVQENDIWITALALEYNLTLVTHDRKMEPLWEAAGTQLRVADWAEPGFIWPSCR